MNNRKKSDEIYSGNSVTHLPGDFQGYYIQNILPLVGMIEAKRKKVFRKLLLGGFIALAIYVTILLLFSKFVLESLSVDFAYMLIFVCAVIAAPCMILLLQSRLGVNYRNWVKSQVYSLIVRYYGDNFTYSAKPKISNKQLLESGLLPRGSRIILSDHISGSFRGVSFDAIEAEAWVGFHYHKYNTIFKGICLFIDYNKPFTGTTYITCEADYIMRIYTLDFMLHYKRFHINNVPFEKRFDVYTTNQAEARCLLTSDFMSDLLRLEKLFNCGIKASFYNGRLLLMMPCENSLFLKTSVFGTPNLINPCNVTIEQMQDIFKIINLFKLYQ